MKFDTAPNIADALESTLSAFRSGDFSRAEALAEGALALDFEHPEIQSALKCAVFWKERMARVASLQVPEEKGEFLLKEWTGFWNRFRIHLDDPFERGLAAVRGSVGEMAAEAFLEQTGLETEPRSSDLMLKAAKAFKGIGSYDRALEILDQVLKGRPDDAGALAEMADCWDAVGEVRKSRLFFREAFYLNAQQVDVAGLQAPVLRNLADSLGSEGYSGAELKEWLPVHAVVKGVFDVKRELKSLEVGQLKQSINTLKAELNGGSGKGPGLPKLLYRYFWLVDHFLSVKEEQSKIEDILLNIKLLDERIYDQYTH